MLQGMINIPLIEDELAVRVVAYQFDNSGFINNVAASQPSLQIPPLKLVVVWFRIEMMSVMMNTRAFV